MITVIKQGSTKAMINKLLQKLFEKKKIRGIDAHKYCGVIDIEDDAIALQKKMRNEWK